MTNVIVVNGMLDHHGTNGVETVKIAHEEKEIRK
jgi:hypothetical protein